MIISNATPLIALAKIQQLQLLKHLFKEVIISSEVKKEVVDRGKEKHYADAFLIEQEIVNSWITVQKEKKLVTIPFPIDLGEHSTISLAVELKKKEVLLDEISARRAAKALGLEPRGTLFVLLEALQQDLISFHHFLQLLHQLAKVGFRLDEKIYTKAIEQAEALRKKK